MADASGGEKPSGTSTEDDSQTSASETGSADSEDDDEVSSGRAAAHVHWNMESSLLLRRNPVRERVISFQSRTGSLVCRSGGVHSGGHCGLLLISKHNWGS